MNPRSSFQRKLIYVAAMVPLLGLLYWLGQPSFQGPTPEQSSPGGVLAQVRHQHGLSQADLGQIDPAGETIRLASLGMRGVAALVLWEKANEYYKKKDFTNFSATVKQTIQLQPHFITVWRFQGWVFAYNCSVQFDDYRERYRWVIKGIDFLEDGLKRNEHEPILEWDIGWFIAQKIGTADERKQYRRLFKDDNDFHGSRPVADRDNWLVGMEKFRKAEDMVDRGDRIVKTPVLFRSEAPKCRINYAEGLEKDGIFGEVAKRAWQLGAADWKKFGDFDIPLTEKLKVKGEEIDKIHLNEQEMYEGLAKDASRKIDELAPGVRKTLLAERLAALSEEERKAVETPPSDRDARQEEMVARIGSRAIVTDDDVVRKITGPNRRQAIDLSRDAAEYQGLAQAIKRSREIVNFEYWRRRGEVEATDDAIAGRDSFYKAEGHRDLDLEKARKEYEAAFASWRKVLDRFPDLIRNDTWGQDLMDMIRSYQKFLEKNFNQQLPDDFPLKDVIEKHGKR